jgi:hypothetical protein
MPENVIDQALDQVADRTAIDWEALERSLNSADERRWLDCVRVLEDIANFHCSPDVADGLASIGGVADAPTTNAGRNEAASSVDTAQWWGRYRLDHQVGEGAFGCVYRAWDPELEREVAVKILHKRVAETRLKQALLREGRALAKVRHPNVVSVLSVESHEDQIALCMEFVHGETLEDVLSRGPLSAGEAMLVCQDVCRALAAVHLAGFVHQDVKARNVMRETAGRIVLMDFGAGRDASQLAGSGRARIAGTPLYMAPEVLAGEPSSAVSDVYSVGVLLYHLVTGEYPVEGQNLDGIRAAHMQARRRLLSERRPELPVTFLQVVDRALAADPTHRYAGAAQFLEALVGVADDVKEVAPVATVKPLVLAVLGLAALGTLVISLGFVACRLFEVILRIDSEFSVSLRDYVRVGREGVLPFVLMWIPAAAGTMLLVGLAMAVRSRAPQVWQRWNRRWQPLNPDVAGAVVFAAGIAAWLALSWTYSDLFVALLELHEDPERARLAAVSSASRPDHLAYSVMSSGLSFLLVFLGGGLLPYMRRRSGDLGPFRAVTWATLLLAVVVMLGPIAPRRFLFERYRVVEYAGQPALEIASAGANLLLYDPRRRVTLKVPSDATSPIPNERTRLIFTDETP